LKDPPYNKNIHLSLSDEINPKYFALINTMVNDHIQDSTQKEEIEIVFEVEADDPNVMAFHMDSFNWRSDFDTNKSATEVTSQSIADDVLVHGQGHLCFFPLGGEPTFNGSCINPTLMNGSPSIKQRMTANDTGALNTNTVGKEFEEEHQIKQCITCSREANVLVPEGTQPLSDPSMKSATISANDPTLQSNDWSPV
jgi:hypothetical protein